MIERRLSFVTTVCVTFLIRQRIALWTLPLLIFFLWCATCRHLILPEQPEQPSSGPGGAEYFHEAVNISSYGQGETQYWIFEPASPIPESAPLIIFNHGWIAMKPQNYGAWIDHIVGRGNVVVFPRYQIATTRAEEMTQYAIIAVKDAIQKLQSGMHVTPQLDKFAIVAHSLGGSISVNMAALAATEDLPEPKAIMLVEPGYGATFGEDILLTDLSSIPSRVLMLIVVASDDTIAGSETGREIFYRTQQIPHINKNFITVVSDYHGNPPFVADHYAPVAPDDRYALESGKLWAAIRRAIQKRLGSEVDALDYYGFWKLFDGLTDAAFYGKNREYALGNTPEQRFMGEWSDGVPVEELQISNNP